MERAEKFCCAHRRDFVVPSGSSLHDSRHWWINPWSYVTSLQHQVACGKRPAFGVARSSRSHTSKMFDQGLNKWGSRPLFKFMSGVSHLNSSWILFHLARTGHRWPFINYASLSLGEGKPPGWRVGSTCGAHRTNYTPRYPKYPCMKYVTLQVCYLGCPPP